MNINEKIEFRNLKRKFPNIIVKENSLYDDSIDIYQNFLNTNISYNIEQICQIADDGGIQTIQNITVPFRNLNLIFSIELINQNYKGRYTIWCPELKGCITEGKSKKEAFNNILWAISEILVINYDYLKCNPTEEPITPLPLNSQINFPNSLFGYGIDSLFTRNLINQYEFTIFYIGKKHLIIKSNNNSINITFLSEGINDLTKFCFDNLLKNYLN